MHFARLEKLCRSTKSSWAAFSLPGVAVAVRITCTSHCAGTSQVLAVKSVFFEQVRSEGVTEGRERGRRWYRST